ncbi:MAG: TIGR04086 family membrane protein [Clostridia bacterium]|nr:TIGR04086 family membrane protein [Clostridia bacterium]
MRTNIFQIVKSVLAAVLISLAFVLIFTVIIQLFSIPMGAVKPVNQVFKILAIALGGLIFIRGDKGLIKGLIYGVIAVIVTFFLFALISWSISFSWKFILEIVLGAIAGGVSGIIAVNIKKGA